MPCLPHQSTEWHAFHHWSFIQLHSGLTVTFQSPSTALGVSWNSCTHSAGWLNKGEQKSITISGLLFSSTHQILVTDVCVCVCFFFFFFFFFCAYSYILKFLDHESLFGDSLVLYSGTLFLCLFFHHQQRLIITYLHEYTFPFSSTSLEWFYSIIQLVQPL